MPNWCSNELAVFGDEHDVERFVADAKTKDEPLSLAKVVPMPDEVDDKPYDPFGYWGRVILWGTKWDVGDVEFVQEWAEYAHYKFDTAWAPPLPFLVRASQKYPQLEFDLRWDEPSCRLFGRTIFENGKLTEMAELKSEPDGNKIADSLQKEILLAFRCITESKIDDKDEFVSWLGLSECWHQAFTNKPVKT